MSLRLARVRNWPERAAQADWCFQRLARGCRVSQRTLEQYVETEFGKSPQDWLRDLMMLTAVELLPVPVRIEEVARELGYKNAQEFGRDFKRHTGCSPGQFSALSGTATKGWWQYFSHVRESAVETPRRVRS